MCALRISVQSENFSQFAKPINRDLTRRSKQHPTHPNTGLFAELVALRIAKVVVRIETRVQCGNQVEQRLSRDCITKVSTFSIFVTVTEASAGTVGE